MSALTPHQEDASLIIRAGRKRYALAARSIREIVPMPPLTRVPLAPEALIGIGSVRGETLAILSLAVLANDSKARAPSLQATRQLLVLEGEVRAGLAIDGVDHFDRGRRDDKSDGEMPALLPIDSLVSSAMPVRAESHRRLARETQFNTTGAAATKSDRIGLLGFRLGSQSFALPVGQVVEVLRETGEIAVLPGSDDAVVGSIIWRDTSLGVLSLAILLGLPASREADNRVIVVELSGHRFGLLVERVDTVISVEPDRIDAVPETLLSEQSEARIAAIYRPASGGRLVSLLAADRLLSDARTRNISAIGAKIAKRQSILDIHDIGDMARQALLPIRVGSDWLALPLVSIRQVTRRPVQPTSVPGSPQWLIGITTIAGVPMPVVDQVARLTGNPATGPDQRLLVIESGDLRAGFLVSGVGRIFHAAGSEFAPAPLPEALADGIFGGTFDPSRGADGSDTGPFLVVDVDSLVSSTERSLLLEIVATGSAVAS